jgi:hypothetical protein
MESRHLQDCCPCLCQLMANGLAPASKYWTYWSHVGDIGPVSLVVGHQQKVDFALTTSLVGSREKLGTDPWLSQSTWYGLCRKLFFSGAVVMFNSIDDYVKGCYKLTTWDTYGLGPYADWAWDACGMLVGFSHVGCTSIRIAASLWYEYRFVAAVIT